MNTLFLGKNFVGLPKVDSTNAFLAGLIHAAPAEGTVVFSAHQTQGRGQQGNTWLSEPDQNIACSVLLHPRFLSPAKIFQLNKAVALALAQALQSLLPGQEILIKWPNDILLNRRKVAGILLENQLGSTMVINSIVGFGVNVNQTKFGEGYGQPISMASAAGQEFELQMVLERILEQLEGRYLALRAGKTEALEHDYLHLLYGFQEEIPLMIDGERKMAMPVGVDTSGRLAVQVDGGMRYFGIKEIAFIL